MNRSGGMLCGGGVRIAPPTAGALLLSLGAAVVFGLGAQEVERLSGPVVLSDAVGLALERNRDILDSEYQLEVADNQVSEAWSNVFPSLDLQSSFTRNVAPQVSFLPAQIFNPEAPEGEFIPIQFGADNIWNLSLNAEQPLFQPGVFVGVGAAARFRGLQREGLRSRKQDIVTQVRVAFFDLLLAQEEVRLTTNSLRRVRQSLTETQAMNRAGLAGDYDVLRLEVEVANLEPNLRRAENRQTALKRTLLMQLNYDVDAEFQAAGTLAELNLADFAENSPENQDILRFSGVGQSADVEDVVSTGLAGRSDLRQLELTEDLRMAELRVEQAEYLPKVTAFGLYGVAAQQNGSPDFFGTSAQRGTTKQLGLRVSFPIFSGFRRDARIDQKRAALRQAEVQSRVGRDQAAVQLHNLVDGVNEAFERATGQRLAVRQARRGYEIASAQYREGLGSQLELTDAEVALRQSEFNYAQAVYDYLTAQAQLDQAAGKVPLVDVDGDASSQEGMGR